MESLDIPSRVLLDTNIVNFILDWNEAIHDGGGIPENVSEQDSADILALRWIWLTGQRASWQLAISPRTILEIRATKDPIRRQALDSWLGELWGYWRTFFDASELSDERAERLAQIIISSEGLAVLPEFEDRELVAHAIAYGCDAMCTRDRRTILRYRDRLKCVPVRILTPSEWWQAIRKYAGLWM